MLRFLLLCLLGLTFSVHALEFYENSTTGEIVATGIVEPRDAEKIAGIITLDYRQRHHNVRNLVTVSLDSPGGSLLGGLRLGYALRRLGVHTNVGANQSCFSACALAFLGGQERTVEGRYGVHAASLNAKAKQGDRNDQLDTIQQLSAITTAYVHEMTGRTDIALRALSTSAAKIAVLDDSELGSMGAITLARRPSQFGHPGFKCPQEHNFTVLSAVCAHIDISFLDQELNVLYAKIQKEGAPAELSTEQDRWRRYRNSCINDGAPNGYSSVVHCVREAYLVRRDQLMSMWLAISAKKSRPGSSNWRPIEPRR
ncbi:lysozyme inhibitor LprI family protein [Melaminivora jejuensis]|uniref:lysozyme inhibitor LprI family protein n=1 Tax=Melaminivora jejuensis TaxID=1267217 RepID=UPI001AE0683C|nr:lysozyme inhibitor LprI family protein [Melaminivora jejuensis]UHJ66519.1 lysozyme inhibitor LprI family protein [Melaminivora jejuensis]